MEQKTTAIVTLVAIVAIIVVVFVAVNIDIKGSDKPIDNPTNELSPIELTFSIDESTVKVMYGDKEIKNNDVVTFKGDAKLVAYTLDGLRHTISYAGSWSNGDERGAANGSELGTSAEIYIVNCIYFGKATGTMKIICG